MRFDSEAFGYREGRNFTKKLIIAFSKIGICAARVSQIFLWLAFLKIFDIYKGGVINCCRIFFHTVPKTSLGDSLVFCKFCLFSGKWVRPSRRFSEMFRKVDQFERSSSFLWKKILKALSCISGKGQLKMEIKMRGTILNSITTSI